MEKQLPEKHEHVVMCKLSKRQRFLYDEFMNAASTRDTLESGNFLGIVNVLMQLRKVRPSISILSSSPPGLSHLLSQRCVVDVCRSATTRTSSRCGRSSPPSIRTPSASTCRPSPCAPSSTSASPSLFLFLFFLLYLCFCLTASLPLLIAFSPMDLDLRFVGLASLAENARDLSRAQVDSILNLQTPRRLIVELGESTPLEPEPPSLPHPSLLLVRVLIASSPSYFSFFLFVIWNALVSVSPPPQRELQRKQIEWRRERIEHAAYINERRCDLRARFTWDVRRALHVDLLPRDVHALAADPLRYWDYPNALRDAVLTVRCLCLCLISSWLLCSRIVVSCACGSLLTGAQVEQRSEQMKPVLERYVCLIPRARAPAIQLYVSRPDASAELAELETRRALSAAFWPAFTPIWTSYIRTQLYFPDKVRPAPAHLLCLYTSLACTCVSACALTPPQRLIQFDCGKLQQLDLLLRELRSGGHRALIFTQMSRMLDVLEIFLNIHGHTVRPSPPPRGVNIITYFTPVRKCAFLVLLMTRSTSGWTDRRGPRCGRR